MTTVVLVVLVLVALVAAGVVVRQRARRRAQAPSVPLPRAAELMVPGPLAAPKPRPVVLVHGILGFDQIRLPGLRIDYFRGIARHLDSLGVTAHAVRLPPTASVPDRARALVDFVSALPDGQVDLVAHSLGGLDARWAISRLGLAPRVASLVTIGTPHRGTPIADLAGRGPFGLARKLVGSVGFDLSALEWLTTEALARFNRDVPDAPGVRYACFVAGARGGLATRIPFALWAAHTYLRRVAGPNDGLVPIDSQVWGEVLGDIEADHWAQVGWSTAPRCTFDAHAFYADLIARVQGLALPAGPAAPLLLPAAAK